MESGETFDDAVAYAQSIGITETDPSADIDGWDAAIKVAALATVLMGVPLKPQQVNRTGIREITPAMRMGARRAGLRWKLVCSCRRNGDRLEARVAPEQIGPNLRCTRSTAPALTFNSSWTCCLAWGSLNPTLALKPPLMACWRI